MVRNRLAIATLSATTAALLMGLWIKSARAEVSVVDAAGAQVTIRDASRIVSIGGDLTEILYALGAGSRIVAVDSTSQYPADALATKKSVGYQRALATEGVLSTDPTVILANERSGPSEVVKALKASQVPYVEVKDNFDPAGIAAKIRLVSKVTGVDAAGEAMAKGIESEFADLARTTARLDKRKRVLFVLAIQNGRATIGGAGTSADAILRLAGADNAAAAINGFKPIGDEGLIEMQPDVIVIMQRGAANHNVDQLLTMKGILATPAGAQKRIIEMDGLYLLGFGPRAPAAARDLMQAIYATGAKSAGSN